ncbi:isochorismatase family cysteine hydrolase [Azospirillum sp. SYSU D00513]|uniref:cysteine hydrolase family protein n=1 Tax=Azospirillum sp. SYSU D00513 TaxID=2812561 RepID=UPI001A95C2D3|nr:isochorismatase family cysteine hydrolase [Azospirillum sp. SYSU D00513]
MHQNTPPARHVEADPYSWPHDGALHPGSTALLVIDMQRDFCHPGGYVASMGYDIAPVQRIVPVIQAVRHAVRSWGGTVIHTREGHRPDLSDLSPLKRWRSRRAGIGIGAEGPMGRLLVRGEPGWDIIPELAPEPGEPVIDKPGYSAFHATDLDQILRARGVRRLVLCGVTTDVCVHSTLRAAVELGYECLLLADACAAVEPALHEAALRSVTMEGGIFGAVTTAGALLSAIA